jgi:hypothetical protein
MADNAKENAVDTTRFDQITASLAQSPSRRGVLRLLGAATFGAGGLAFLADAEAKKRRKKKKKKKTTCNDGKKNGSETDVDCGGPKCSRCGLDKTCNTRDDCITALCSDRTCKEPANQAECGNDSDGTDCATRENSDGVRFCSKFEGNFFLDGTCESRCKGEEQCVLPISGGVECVLPCGA